MTPHAKRRSPARLLIVDDDPLAVDVMKTYLEEWYEIVVARSAEDAVQLCKTDPPDLVLMDLMMPTTASYEGDEAIRRLTGNPKTSTIPIIIQTGFSGSRTLNLRALGPSVRDVLIKPVDLEILKKKVEQILSKKGD